MDVSAVGFPRACRLGTDVKAPCALAAVDVRHNAGPNAGAVSQCPQGRHKFLFVLEATRGHRLTETDRPLFVPIPMGPGDPLEESVHHLGRRESILHRLCFSGQAINTHTRRTLDAVRRRCCHRHGRLLPPVLAMCEDNNPLFRRRWGASCGWKNQGKCQGKPFLFSDRSHGRDIASREVGSGPASKGQGTPACPKASASAHRECPPL